MISANNAASGNDRSDADFTEHHYRELIRSARRTYAFATYDDIPWDQRFVLWRHDLDYSIQRAWGLAQIEADEGAIATYFVNPHSEFYNPLEAGQARLIDGILRLDHRLGLHFDAAFYGTRSEADLDEQVATEVRWLEQAFGVRPDAFSFHNPVEASLKCERETYGGIANTYSLRLKTEVAYCSDSNGYWRFRRLADVLAQADNLRLQVLTHPGWWQVEEMPPRKRIFRAAYGRAVATMRYYDREFVVDGGVGLGRINHPGPSAALDFMRRSMPGEFELCDYLWNAGRLETLFLELWRLRGKVVSQPGHQIHEAKWLDLRAQVASGTFNGDASLLEQGCTHLCAVIGDELERR